MKDCLVEIVSNKKIADGVYEMTLKGDYKETRPGQFLELALPGRYLRRPFGIADREGDAIKILYKVQGAGTAYMTELMASEKLSLLTPLGNGFNFYKADTALILGGGIGIAPLFYLAKSLSERGVHIDAVLGFRTGSESFYIDEFKKYANVTVVTDDGTLGLKGNVVTVLNEVAPARGRYYACGATPMLRAVQKYSDNGELSLEARMACGFGACMGCSIKTKSGAKRVCKEGPVFDAAEVIFDD